MEESVSENRFWQYWLAVNFYWIDYGIIVSTNGA
jgi:hypothetical protein